MTTKIDMSAFIEGLRTVRSSTNHDEFYIAEYIYHLISVLLESQKLINNEFFSPEYIKEHAYILSSYACQTRDEVLRKVNANK